MTEEQVRLLGFQAALEKEEGGRPGTVGLSLNETIRQCFIKGNVKKAEKLRGDFKVPDKRYWRCERAPTELVMSRRADERLPLTASGYRR